MKEVAPPPPPPPPLHLTSDWRGGAGARQMLFYFKWKCCSPSRCQLLRVVAKTTRDTLLAEAVSWPHPAGHTPTLWSFHFAPCWD